MALILTQTDTAAPNGLTAGCSGRSLGTGGTASTQIQENGTAGSTPVSIGPGNNQSNVYVWALQSPSAGINASTWAAGNYVVRMNVTTANSNVQWTETYICERTSGGTYNTVASLTGQTTSLGTTGVKTHTVNRATNFTAAGTDSTLYIVIVVSNVGKGGQTVGVTPDQNVDTPITVAAAVNGSATVTGSATVSATGRVAVTGAASATGAASVTATATVAHNASATVTGAATTEASASVTTNGSATVSGSGFASAVATVLHAATAIAAGAAFVVGTATVQHSAAATATGSGYAEGTGVLGVYGLALASGTSDAFGTATVSHVGAGSATGVGYASATATVVHEAQATVTGYGYAEGTGTIEGSAFGEATVTGSGFAAGTATVAHEAQATVTGYGYVEATGTIQGSANGQATVTGSSEATGTATVAHAASGSATGSATATATASVLHEASGSATGVGYAEGTGVISTYGLGLATGTSDAFGTASLVLPGSAGTATGSGYVSATATVLHKASATATGLASVTGVGTVFQTTVYGSATVTGSGYAEATGYIPGVSASATVTGSGYAEATGYLPIVGGVATVTGKAFAWAGEYPSQGYFAYLYNGEYFRLAKWSALTGLVILDEVAFEHAPGTYYNIVLEADGNTLNAKVWEGNPNIPPGVADDENEPVGWMISVTDPDYAGGTPGLVALGTADVKFDVFSTGLGGSTYPLGRLPGAPTWVTPSVPFSVPENDPIVPLSWLRPFMTGDVLGGVVNYELEYKREADSEWTFLTSTGETSYDWDLSRYPNSESYCVRVRAYVGCEYGPWAEICGIGWGGQAPTFETPDGYYFGDDNVGEPDHGMWIRLFQASHRDDEFQVYSCLVTRELLLGGVGGECLFKKLYVNLTYSTAGQCVVTPILDGERVTEETRYIDLDPGGGVVTRRFEIDLTRGYDVNGTERFRYGLRGSYFQVEICVTDIGGTGRIEIDGIELMYTPARETHTWARPFYGELETDIQPDILPGYFFGTEADDVGAAIYELATNDRDFGRELRIRLQPRAVAPFGTSMEAWFRTLYICVTRSNTTDGQLKVTPIIDGTELEAEYVTLTGTSQPKTEVLEVPLKIRYPSSTLERSTYGIRGLWFTYRIETVGGRPDGELSFDGCAVEAIPSRETEPGVT